MVQGGMKCVKFLLFAFNLLFFLAGLGLIIAGALVQTQFEQYFALLGTSFNGAAILLIVVGSIVFVIGFFGCCGAYKENYCMVMTFAVLLGLVFILEVAAGITAYVMSDTVKGFVRKQMTKGLEEYKNETDVQKAWDTTQTQFKCCGVDAPEDWCASNKTHDLPDSCCNLASTTVEISQCTKGQCPVKDPSRVYNKGCLQQLSTWVARNIYVIGGVGIGLAFVQIVGIILACCLARTIKKEYDVV